MFGILLAYWAASGIATNLVRTCRHFGKAVGHAVHGNFGDACGEVVASVVHPVYDIVEQAGAAGFELSKSCALPLIRSQEAEHEFNRQVAEETGVPVTRMADAPLINGTPPPFPRAAAAVS